MVRLDVDDPKAAEELIPTRRTLLSRLKDLDDEKSWKVFFDTYWKLIYRTARRAGLTSAEAEDVVQETVISVSKQMGHFVYDPAKGSFKSYLLKLTQWRIADQMRKRLPVDPAQAESADPDSEVEQAPTRPIPPDLEALWDREWEQNLLEAAMQRVKESIDPRLYQAFDLYARRNWPPSKVAADLRMTTARVYVAKHQVGRLLKKELARLRSEPI